MNGKSWYLIGLIAVFLATCILVAEFMFPWIVIVGFIAYTILGYGLLECVEKECVAEAAIQLEGYECALETYKNALNNSKNETVALAQKNKDLKKDFKDVSKDLSELHASYKELLEKYNELNDRYGELEKVRRLNVKNPDEPRPKRSKNVDL